MSTNTKHFAAKMKEPLKDASLQRLLGIIRQNSGLAAMRIDDNNITLILLPSIQQFNHSVALDACQSQCLQEVQRVRPLPLLPCSVEVVKRACHIAAPMFMPLSPRCPPCLCATAFRCNVALHKNDVFRGGAIRWNARSQKQTERKPKRPKTGANLPEPVRFDKEGERVALGVTAKWRSHRDSTGSVRRPIAPAKSG